MHLARATKHSESAALEPSAIPIAGGVNPIAPAGVKPVAPGGFNPVGGVIPMGGGAPTLEAAVEPLPRREQPREGGQCELEPTLD